MIKRVILLAAMRGYRGHYHQVSVLANRSQQGAASVEDEPKEMKQNCSWHNFKDRLVKEGTSYHGEKFSLGVINKHGEPVSNIPQVDAVINEAVKTIVTPLVEAMERKGYINVFEGEKVYAKHPTLFGERDFSKGTSTACTSRRESLYR
jgi:hypothetical protein